jgi:hypothetical protein
LNNNFKGALFLLAVLSFFGLWLSAATGQTPADIPKQDFFGTWKMLHDGWEGSLILKAGGAAKILAGQYKGSDGRIHTVSGSAEGHKVTFQIDFNDSNTFTSQDQIFTGYLFTQGRSGIAGTTSWSGLALGWYATKQSAATSFPVVSTDLPDPEGGVTETAVITSSSGIFRVFSGKAEYAKGEAVDFHVSNELNRMVKLAGIYYVIKYKADNVWKEFYTSQRDFLQDLTMANGKERQWTWDQWDNERQNKAKAGKWRIKIFIPDVRPEPLFVEFSIKTD